MEIRRILKESIIFVLITALCFTMLSTFSLTEAKAASKTHLKKTRIELEWNSTSAKIDFAKWENCIFI